MWQVKRKNKPVPLTPEQQLLEIRKSRCFLGVQVSPCGCRASARYAGRFFPFKKAPPLPVDGCDAAECTCQYLGIKDRRGGLDRRADMSGGPNKKRRRMRFDRRRGLDVWKGFDR